MRILFLAPHPFYQDRGSPIAVAKILEVLSEREEQIDVITYHGGREVRYQNIAMYRTPDLFFLRNIRPGFSWKKVISDIFMLAKALLFAMRRSYDLIYAVEEAVYIALVIKALLKIPYVYDMDSSLAEQMVEQYPLLGVLQPVLYWFESIAVKNAKVVVPVCDMLARDIRTHKPKKVIVLYDVSLLRDDGHHKVKNGWNQFGNNRVRLMYVGNLQEYQGIKLLLESLALALKKTELIELAIIGGGVAEIRKLRRIASRLGIDRNVEFLGPRSVEQLGMNIAQADILVSPRIKGKATPMKIYTYLDSGKPILATDLPTHTQVLNNQSAVLAEPSPEAFSNGILRLVQDRSLRLKLGIEGKKLVEERFPYSAFRKKADSLFDWLEAEFDQDKVLASEIV